MPNYGHQLDQFAGPPVKPSSPSSLVEGTTDYDLELENSNEEKLEVGKQLDYNLETNQDLVSLDQPETKYEFDWNIYLEPIIPNYKKGSRKIYYDTTDNWNAQTFLVSERGSIYIYSDYSHIYENGEIKQMPGIKVGDGAAYLIDLPFIVNSNSSAPVDIPWDHFTNTTIHVTQTEKDSWNNKVTTYINSYEPETLIFTKN